MKILAIDPGITTGMALLEDTRGHPEVTFSQHIQYDDFIHLLGLVAHGEEETKKRFYDVRLFYNSDNIVVENYRLYAHKASAQINSEFETVQLIGIIKFTLEKFLQIGYTLQMAHQIKVPLLSDSNLEERWGIVLNNKHERDAARHALLYWLRNTKSNSNTYPKGSAQ